MPHDPVVFGGISNQRLFSVATGGPGLVAVGIGGSGRDSSAAVWTSPDGLAWTQVPEDEAVFGGVNHQGMNSVVAGGPGLVAVGVSSDAGGDFDVAVWTSVDGSTWTRVPHDEMVFGLPGDQETFSVAAGGPGLVAVGHDGSAAAVWYWTPDE